jgi:hypothetical protein
MLREAITAEILHFQLLSPQKPKRKGGDGQQQEESYGSPTPGIDRPAALPYAVGHERINSPGSYRRNSGEFEADHKPKGSDDIRFKAETQ